VIHFQGASPSSCQPCSLSFHSSDLKLKVQSFYSSCVDFFNRSFSTVHSCLERETARKIILNSEAKVSIHFPPNTHPLSPPTRIHLLYFSCKWWKNSFLKNYFASENVIYFISFVSQLPFSPTPGYQETEKEIFWVILEKC
jgi:hypothetical protein